MGRARRPRRKARGEVMGEEGARPRAREGRQNDDSLMRRERISPGISRHETGVVLFHIVPYCSRGLELYKA
jgi:hypothetical protein